jgi:hypothetical protein
MSLYVSIVLLAELSALPPDLDNSQLLSIMWGTTIGVALAHWFAFEFAARRLHGRDRTEVFEEVGGSATVAAVASIPVLLFPQDVHQQLIPFVLALFIATVGYLVERSNGRSRRWSLWFAVVALVVGLAVAGVKDLISYH